LLARRALSSARSNLADAWIATGPLADESPPRTGRHPVRHQRGTGSIRGLRLHVIPQSSPGASFSPAESLCNLQGLRPAHGIDLRRGRRGDVPHPEEDDVRELAVADVDPEAGPARAHHLNRNAHAARVRAHRSTRGVPSFPATGTPSALRAAETSAMALASTSCLVRVAMSRQPTRSRARSCACGHRRRSLSPQEWSIASRLQRDANGVRTEAAAAATKGKRWRRACGSPRPSSTPA
jgi:hypothetical protein